MQKYLAEYLRLSMEDGDVASDNDKQESNSISHQRALIAEYKSKYNLSNMQSLELVDDGYSGTNFNRPAVMKLLKMVKEGKINCIIVKDISRFGRNYLEVGDYLEQIFPFMGVRFISLNDHYDSNDYIGTTGGIEVAFKSLLYDMYSQDLSTKMCSALQIRRKRGDYIGPRPPFGYAFSTDRRKLAVDPVAAEYVKFIFSLANLGYSTGMIARRLNNEGIPTPGQYKNTIVEKETYHILDGDGFWNAKKVLKIIQNKVYLGVVVNKKQEVNKIGGKKFTRVPDEEQICVPNMHEAIISEEIFQSAVRVIKNTGAQRYKKHKRKSASILLGKLYCGECHRSLVRVDSTTIPYFKCEKPDFDAQCSCPRLHLQEPEIEKVVWKCILLEISKTENLQKLATVKSKVDELKNQIARLLSQNKKLKSDKQNLYERYKTGILSKEKYQNQVEILREKDVENINKVDELERKQKEAMKNLELTNCMEKISVLDKETVNEMIEKIKIYKENRIEIVWRHKVG